MKKHFTIPGGFDVVGPRSLSWSVWLIGAVAPQALDTLLGKFGFGLPAIVALGGVTLVSAGLILIPGWLVLPRLQKSSQKRWLIWACYLGSSVASAALVVGILTEAERLPAYPLVQVITGSLFFPWCLTIAAMFINDRSVFLTSMATLSIVRAQLQAVANWRQTDLESMRTAMLDRIRSQLRGVMSSLGDIRLDKGALAGITDKIVRPLLADVDEFTFDKETALSRALPPMTRRRPARAVFDRAFDGNRDFVFPVSLFCATGWLGTGLGLGNWVLLPALVILGGVVPFLTLWLSSRWPVTLLRKAPLWLRIPIVLLMWFIASAAGNIPAVLISGIPLGVVTAIALPTIAVSVLLSVIFARRHVGAELRADIQRENNLLERQLTENSIHSRNLRESLRRFIHADIQSALIYLERQTDPENLAKASALVADLLESVTYLSDQLDQFSPRDIQETIKELTSVWEGVLTISFKLSTTAERALAKNDIASGVLSEVLIEVTTNAVKHRFARELDISVSLTKSKSLAVTALSRPPEIPEDNERESTPLDIDAQGSTEQELNPKMNDSVVGQGTRLFNDVCLSWSIESTDRSSLFRATIPLVEMVRETQLS